MNIDVGTNQVWYLKDEVCRIKAKKATKNVCDSVYCNTDTIEMHMLTIHKTPKLCPPVINETLKIKVQWNLRIKDTLGAI